MDNPNISIRVRYHESSSSLQTRHRSTVTSSSSNNNKSKSLHSSCCGDTTGLLLRRRNSCTPTTSSSSLSSSSSPSLSSPVLVIGRRLTATKTNPHIGSFRHAPPTSLRSMEATSSSLSFLASRIRYHSTRAAYDFATTTTHTARLATPGIPVPPRRRERSSSLSSLSSSSFIPTSSSFLQVTTVIQVPAMKQSPYVGWFRHAPSLSAGTVSTSATKQNQQQQQQQQQKKKNMFTVHKIDLDSFLDLNR